VRYSGSLVDVSPSAARAVFSPPSHKKETTMFSLNHRSSFRSPSVLSINRSLTSVVLGLWAAIIISSPAFGQSVTGNISGSVTDPNGAVVAGASVTLVNDQTKDKRDQVTNDSGRFNFASVQPGVYTLKIEHQGFETMLRTKVILSANEALALGELPMKTGQVTETVTIQSEGQIVEKESSDLQARLTADQISLISTK